MERKFQYLKGYLDYTPIGSFLYEMKQVNCKVTFLKSKKQVPCSLIGIASLHIGYLDIVTVRFDGAESEIQKALILVQKLLNLRKV